jgi:putative endonuclease
MKSYWVYMLRCSDNSYYIGMTGNIEQRLAQHDAGSFPSCYTFKRRPLECVYSVEFSEVIDAIRHEKQLKGWSRKKKEMIIQEQYDQLHKTSACSNGSHHVLYKLIACNTERRRSAIRVLIKQHVSIPLCNLR